MAHPNEIINSPVGMLPPGAVIGAGFAGLTLNEWVLLGSAILIGLQLFVLIRDKFYTPWKERRERSVRPRPVRDTSDPDNGRYRESAG